MGEHRQTRLSTAFGQWQLQRWPRGTDPTLRAWDAADELLLDHLVESHPDLLSAQPDTLLLNDTHGALSTVLHRLTPVSWSDSWLAHRAAQQNLTLNGIENPLRRLTSLEAPAGVQQLVLIRIPKTLALLEDQLVRLRPHVDAQTLIIATAMLKHLPPTVFGLIERHIGSVSTSLARKKARLLFIKPDTSLPMMKSPYPDSFTDKETGLTLCNHANVFSRNRLDNGARFLMSRFDTLSPARDVVDLGCGNGILGIMLQRHQPEARVEFIDESYMAVASARENHARLLVDREVEATFTVADGLDERDADSVDRILCNPPFHQQHVIGTSIARQLFEGSQRCLRRGGELLVVANRHLNYTHDLKHLFGGCRTLGRNSRFTLLRAVRR